MLLISLVSFNHLVKYIFGRDTLNTRRKEIPSFF